jgi:hypothetical protein
MAAGVRDLERCELIEGDLIDKPGKNRPHVNSLVLTMAWLIQVSI